MLTFGQMVPPYVRLQIRLTFSQASVQADLWSVFPWQRHLMAKCATSFVRLTSGQIYPQQRHLLAKRVATLVRLTSGQMFPPGGDMLWPSLLLLWSDVPSQQRNVVAKCFTTSVRLTFGQMCPLGWGFGSGWHLVRLQVRLTFVFFFFPFPKVAIHQIDGGRICINWSGQKIALIAFPLNLMQEYVIRQCRYKTANGPCK